MRLAGKVALISGGARGMGAAEAAMFCQEGASVVIGDVLEADGKALEAQISAKGGHIAFVRLDVTSEADWKTAVERAVSRFGKLDVLVNNAGISAHGRVEEVADDDRGAFRGKQAGFRRAHATCTAADQRDLAGESGHRGITRARRGSPSPSASHLRNTSPALRS